MSFVTAFASAVPTDNKADYVDHARQAAEIFKRHGATRVMECWGADVPDGEVTSFPLAVKRQDDETVALGYVEWPSKAVHDEQMPNVMEAIGEAIRSGAMSMPPFDGKRLIFGGFAVVLDV